MKRVALVVSAGALAIALATACTHVRPPRSPGHELALSKCGACHLRPEPGTLERGFLARKLSIDHGRRVPMSESERTALLDYLAPQPTTTATASGSAVTALP